MGLGRGLYPVVHDNGGVSYKPTAETIRRADEMGHYYQAHTGRITMLLCSGGFPEVASRGKATRPPEGENEATMQANRLETKWGVPKELLAVEGDSGSTFDDFIKSIEAGYIVPENSIPITPWQLQPVGATPGE